MAGKMLDRRLLYLGLVLLCLAAFCVDFTEAGSRNRAGKKRARGSATPCKYSKVKSECDPALNTRNMTFTLKKGDPETCPETKVMTLSCKKKEGCEYQKKGEGLAWSDCDPHTSRKSLSKPVVEGAPDHCPEVHVKVRRCKSASSSRGAKRASKKARRMKKKMRKNKGKQRKNKKNRKMNKKLRRKERRRMQQQSEKACRYKKQPWSPCTEDPVTGEWFKQRETHLATGKTVISCQPKKIVRKPCKRRPGLEGCNYTKDSWSECDSATRTKQRILTPVAGSDVKCVVTMETKPCRYRAELKAPKTSKCRYTTGEWGQCNARTNTKTALMRLKSGDPNICPRAKEFTRKCKPECKFGRGEWSECDPTTDVATRRDPLTKGSTVRCNGTREVHRKCKRHCKYEYDDWSACDPVTNTRSRVKRLIGGDPGCSSAEGETEGMEFESCLGDEGTENCQFGSWGEFEPCTNGVSIRKREVFTGGTECWRLGADTRRCEN